MTAKNPFKKHATIFAKGKNSYNGLTIERHGNDYYISDGFTMLKINNCFYQVYIQPVSELFILLEDNTCIRYVHKSAPIIKKSDTLKNYFEHFYPTTNAHKVEFTSIFVNTANGIVRIAKIHNKIAVFNDEFCKAVFDYSNAFSKLTFFSDGILNGVYFTCEEKVIEGLIMPIRPDSILRVLRDIVGVANL